VLVVFLEPWKLGMASTELPRLAGKNDMDGLMRFLKYHAFAAISAESLRKAIINLEERKYEQ
jgi:hypothetical protein